jgi:hypothetical protein
MPPLRRPSLPDGVDNVRCLCCDVIYCPFIRDKKTDTSLSNLSFNLSKMVYSYSVLTVKKKGILGPFQYLLLLPFKREGNMKIINFI